MTREACHKTCYTWIKFNKKLTMCKEQRMDSLEPWITWNIVPSTATNVNLPLVLSSVTWALTTINNVSLTYHFILKTHP